MGIISPMVERSPERVLVLGVLSLKVAFLQDCLSKVQGALFGGAPLPHLPRARPVDQVIPGSRVDDLHF